MNVLIPDENKFDAILFLLKEIYIQQLTTESKIDIILTKATLLTESEIDSKAQSAILRIRDELNLTLVENFGKKG